MDKNGAAHQEIHREPGAFPRRVLLAVTGLTPQVVTETLYALAVSRRPPFVPTEIHVLTTAEGAEHARLMLLDPDDGRFYQLCEEYGLPRLAFAPERVHVLADREQQALSDITCEDHHTAVADAITEWVRRLTADPDCALHASIAGGRKTMGFYLGYALSLFGRPQDRLSHVLVSQPFESDHQFYYPPARPKRLIIKERPVHTSEARVMLADIPFVRLRDGLPNRLLKGHANFSETVAAAQRALAEPELALDLAGRGLLASGEPVRLNPADFAFYLWFARRCIASQQPVSWRDEGLAQQFLDVYRDAVGEMSAEYNEYERAAQAVARGMDKGYFEQRRSKTNRALADALGKQLAAPYLITASGKRPHTRYGLTLKPHQIRLVERAEAGRGPAPAIEHESRDIPAPGAGAGGSQGVQKPD